MKAEYEAVWRELSCGSVELVDYYQRNSLAGGGYFRRRFQYDKEYRPFLLRRRPAASSCSPSKIRGQPRPSRPNGCGTDSRFRRAHAVSTIWKKCPPIAVGNATPFLPENGYGEVIVNGAAHEWKSMNLTTQEVSTHNNYQFRNRYPIVGSLTCRTPLHAGDGDSALVVARANKLRMEVSAEMTAAEPEYATTSFGDKGPILPAPR